MDITSKLQKLRDLKSYSIPAKRLKEHLKPILSKRQELEKRWIWELMQNATDLGENISVKIKISEGQLSFSHNGKPFSLSDTYNLIMPDSGKDEEHEREKSVIGQFGTGFISTHILSRIIEVDGIAYDEEDHDFYEFAFELNRSERRDKEELINSIKKSEQDLHSSLKRTKNYKHTQEFGTTFTYDLNQTYEGVNGNTVVDKGIDYFYDLIPYVFCFRPQLDSVKLNDSRGKKEKWRFKKRVIDTPIEGLSLLKVIAYKNREEQWETIVGSIANRGVTIAFELDDLENNKFEIQPYPDQAPKLFCAFPMIGSEDFNFPVITNSEEFVPNRERDGIEVSNYDEENRACIEKAVEAYQKLLGIVEKYGWTKVYNICGFLDQPPADSTIKRWWHRGIKVPIDKGIYTHTLIDAVDDQGRPSRITLKNAMIPYADGRLKDKKQIIKTLYDLSVVVMPEYLPIAEDYEKWYELLDFNLFDKEKLTIEELLDHTSKAIRSLDQFVEEAGKNENEAIAWINRLVAFLIEQDEVSLLNQYPIVASQSGNFAKLGRLKMDEIHHNHLHDSAEERLKDIYLELTGEDYRDNLIHHDIQEKETIKDDNDPETLKSFCQIIDKELREFSGSNQDPEFLSSLKLMFNWYTNCGLGDEMLAECFPWFSTNKPQLYMDTQTPMQREHTFDILLSGKTEALAKIANSSLSDKQLQTLADNTSLVTSFMDWLNQKVIDNPDEELGDIGEEFVFHELCKRFGEEKVKWVKENEYDFIVYNGDGTVRYYVDAKTTARGINNSDNVPFFMRHAQWNFLPKKKVRGRYVIARVFKQGNNYGIRFLNIRPEDW